MLMRQDVSGTAGIQLKRHSRHLPVPVPHLEYKAEPSDVEGTAYGSTTLLNESK